jgi:pyruvate formate lyase activating enzyme
VAPTLEFARRLSLRGNQIWVRFVLVPGLTDDESNVDGLARAVASLPAVQRVDVVPFHRLGQEKYARLGLRASLEGTEPPSALLLARVRDQFASYGLSVS